MGGSVGSTLMRCLPKCRTLNSTFRIIVIYFLLTRNIQADQMELLERERAWKEEEFDFVLQFLRTVLLKRRSNPIA